MSGSVCIFALGLTKMIFLISSKHSNSNHDNSSFLFIYLLIVVAFPVCLALCHVKMNLTQSEPLQRGQRHHSIVAAIYWTFATSWIDCVNNLTRNPGVDEGETLFTHRWQGGWIRDSERQSSSPGRYNQCEEEQRRELM